jgi:hypothetical protein
MAPTARLTKTTATTATTKTAIIKPGVATATRPAIRSTAKGPGIAGKGGAARAVKTGVRGVRQKKGGKQEQAQEYEYDHDVSLDGADLLGVSSQLSSDTGK